MITGYLLVLEDKDIHTDVIAGHISLQVDKFIDGDKPLIIMFKDVAMTEFLKDIANIKLKMEEKESNDDPDE